MGKKKRKGPSKRSVYWLTPKAAGKSCSHCGVFGAVAWRPKDHKLACLECIDRLGIHARESRNWREAGPAAGAPVTVRFVDPESLR